MDKYRNDRSGYGGYSGYQSPEYSLPKVIFFDADDKEKTTIRSALIDTEAKQYAEVFVKKEKKIKASQLRKFYGTIKTLELSWHSKGGDTDAFKAILPQIKLMKAKSAYAKGRKVVPETFATWLDSCVDAVTDTRDFEAFLLYFEAVVGFAYGAGLTD